MGVNFFKEISKFGFFKTLGKGQNKFTLAEEIGCGNEQTHKNR